MIRLELSIKISGWKDCPLVLNTYANGSYESSIEMTYNYQNLTLQIYEE